MVVNLNHHPYLIIGGTTKAATTSLFSYLSDHPQVCASFEKETRFFLDIDYPVPPISISWENGIERYEDFFKYSSKREQAALRLEATPDYLYSLGTPHRISESLENIRFIFILREPISRLISWYRYAKQQGLIAEKMSLDDYILLQLQSVDSNFEKLNNLISQESNPQDQIRERSFSIPQSYPLSSLKHGFYSAFLKPYLEIFGHDRVKVIFYEDLAANPANVLKKICRFSKIDEKFYETYQFQRQYNRSKTMRSAKLNYSYGQVRRFVRRLAGTNQSVRLLLQKMSRLMDPIYTLVNVSSPEKIVLSSDLRDKLEKVYCSEIQALEQLLGYSVPWFKQ